MASSKFKKTCQGNTGLKFKIIAIDGPAGAGKSTAAKLLARRLGFLYLDTGAMYRALTLAIKKAKVNFQDKNALIRIARKVQIRLKRNRRGDLDVYLNEKLVNKELRNPSITSLVSFIAPIEAIRKIMVSSQRAIGNEQNCVVEGRDIGTVVFPDAFIKFYLDASLGERGRRRFKELKARNVTDSQANVKESIRRRDRSDLTRSFGPLKKASDAIYIDTSKLTVNEMVDKLFQEVLKKTAKRWTKSS